MTIVQRIKTTAQRKIQSTQNGVLFVATVILGIVRDANASSGFNQYGIRRDHLYAASITDHFRYIAAKANADPWQFPRMRFGYDEFRFIQETTLTRSNSGLWKRIAENWEVANYCLRNLDDKQERRALLVWLACTEAFLIDIAIETNIWRSWNDIDGSKLDVTPPTMRFDQRFALAVERTAQTELPDELEKQFQHAITLWQPDHDLT